MIGVHVAGGNEDERPGAAGQRCDGAPDLARLAGDIDQHVPLLAGDLAVGTGAVPVSVRERRAGRYRARLAAGQAGDVMPALHRGGRDAAAKPRRAAENQKPHAHSRRQAVQVAQPNSPTAQRTAALQDVLAHGWQMLRAVQVRRFWAFPALCLAF